MGRQGLPSSPSLAGLAWAFCLAARGQAFVAHHSPLPSFSGAESVPRSFPRYQHRESIMLPAPGPPPRHCCSSARRTRGLGAVAPSMLTSSPSSSRSRRAGGGAGSSSSSSSSSSTALFAEGGGEPMGPGTQQLSRQAKLAISVLIDLIGMSSYALPGVGEAADLGWAPISSALIFYLYGNSIFAGLAFVEEILPGLDIIPTATIAWFLTNSEVGKNVTNAATGKSKGAGGGPSSVPPPPPPASPPFSKTKFGQGGGGRKVDDDQVQSGVIDVESED
ncbi:unnamed protein product [Scytosiphon promiscuus]